MKKHLSWYFKGFPSAAHIRDAVFRCESSDDVLKVIDEVENIIT
jgi:tRNA-dihydrouridine synthase